MNILKIFLFWSWNSVFFLNYHTFLYWKNKIFKNTISKTKSHNHLFYLANVIKTSKEEKYWKPSKTSDIHGLLIPFHYSHKNSLCYGIHSMLKFSHSLNPHFRGKLHAHLLGHMEKEEGNKNEGKIALNHYKFYVYF